MGREGLGERVSPDPASAPVEVLAGLSTEAPLQGDHGRCDDMVALEEGVQPNVRGIEDPMEVRRRRPVMSVHEETEEAFQEALVVQEFVAIEELVLDARVHEISR